MDLPDEIWSEYHRCMAWNKRPIHTSRQIRIDLKVKSIFQILTFKILKKSTALAVSKMINKLTRRS